MEISEGKVLAIDDNEDILFALKILLKPHLEKIDTLSSPESIPEIIKKEHFDVILLDMNFKRDAMSGQEGYYWLNKILQIDPEAVVILITAYGDSEKAVRAIKEGANDFVIKPWQNEKMLATIFSSIKLSRSKRKTKQLEQKQEEICHLMNASEHDFIGQSPCMIELYKTIQKVAKTDANVLILGENGTGKELVAQALHNSSLRKDEVFVSVDLGAVHENLFESELFGHVKGAFTDAKKDKPGRFEIASHGTLFLDEIGNLSLPLQSKLLTALERREVNRLGSNQAVPVDVRLICATNSDIHLAVSEELFRQDLLYRINTVEIHLPPLRERVGDIPLLADHFLSLYARKYRKKRKKLSKHALDKISGYRWPGNVREFRHAIERAVIMSEQEMIQEQDFSFSSSKQSGESWDFDSYNLEQIEKAVVEKVMKIYQGNISQAAKTLGITRTSLYRRLEKYEI